MSIAKELFKLQEIDREIASGEQTRSGILEKMKENKALIETVEKLEAAKIQSEDCSRRQRKVELEIDDLTAKLKKFEEELYSGRTTNTKELAGLQKEIEILKPQREKLEEQDLELMESLEQSNRSVSSLEDEVQQLETAWAAEQKSLDTELKRIEQELSSLAEKRSAAAKQFDTPILSTYEELRKQRGTAVSKVERGICQGCRIQLPVNEFQQVRSGQMIRCSSCGRILFTDQ